MLLALLVLSAVAAWPSSSSSAASVLISSYNFPVFNGTTTTTTDGGGGGGLVVATNSSILSPATFLFDAQLFPEFNQSDGFVLLSRTVDLWCTAAAADFDIEGSTAGRREASFNTSFTVDVDGFSSGNLSSGTVAFVVLLDSFPPLNSEHGHRGGNDSAVSASGIAEPINASNSFAAVEVGTVNSYGPRSPGVGLNVSVTVTPNRTSPTPSQSLAVRIEYDAVAHHISVYVVAATDAGERWPLTARLLDAPLDLAGRVTTTQTAFVGFFAATVRDVVGGGVRDWQLTVDRFSDDDDRRDDEPTKESTPSSSSSSSSRLVVPLAVAGSVAAVAAAAASVVVCISLSRRRALDLELKQCYSNYFARRGL